MLMQALWSTNCYVDHESGTSFYPLVEGDIVAVIGSRNIPQTMFWRVITQHGIADIHLSNFKIICISDDEIDKRNYNILKKILPSIAIVP